MLLCGAMGRWATNHRVFKLFAIAFFISCFTVCQVKAEMAESVAEASSAQQEYKPVNAGRTEYRVLQGNATDARRKLAPFQLCLLCKCCSGGSGSICTTMPCCFGIDCQLPNKPFGVCAFVPKTCNCNSCTG